MLEASDSATDVYEEDLNDSTICDLSNGNLDCIPEFTNKLLSVLYLQDNKIAELPEDFFPSLPSLMWLDLRDNRLTEIPKTIRNHPSLTHLLLQNNKITSLPAELGTVVSLKVLQLNGNPLTFPPKDIICAGVQKIKRFLHNKFIEELFEAKADLSSNADTDKSDFIRALEPSGVSYNSVIDRPKYTRNKMSVVFNEKDLKLDDIDSDSDEEKQVKIQKKCPRLPASRSKPLPPACQSARCLKPKHKMTKFSEARDLYLKQMTVKKRKEYLARIERTLQERKTLEAMKNWRQAYRYRQMFAKGDHKLDPQTLPYDTHPDYMNMLTREDIEKDLPDKYRKKLVRKSKPSVARKNNSDVHLALKIKELFENLEAIDLRKETLTPRSEQKMLLGEIQKISEIKHKLDELSTTNIRSVVND